MSERRGRRVADQRAVTAAQTALSADAALVTAAAVASAASWAWVASGVRTFTHPAEVLTFLPGLAVLALTLRPSATLRPSVQSSRGSATSKSRAGRWGALPWVAVGAAVIGWELVQLFEQPRHLHPTLSSVTDALLGTHPSRFIGYLAWLALGWLLVRDLGGRRE